MKLTFLVTTFEAIALGAVSIPLVANPRFGSCSLSAETPLQQLGVFAEWNDGPIWARKKRERMKRTRFAFKREVAYY